MTGFKLFLSDIAMLIGAFATILISGFSAFADNCENVPGEILRLHILANSDSKEDQSLKYDLRDMMLVKFTEIFSDCDSLDTAIKTAYEHLSEMEKAAQQFIYSRGYDYKVQCSLSQEYFTTRRYENNILPAGGYNAVRIEIGRAEGKNWWCVMFPPLCLPAAGEFYTEEQSKRTEENRDIEIRFAIFELLNNLFSKDNNDSKIVSAVENITRLTDDLINSIGA